MHTFCQLPGGGRSFPFRELALLCQQKEEVLPQQGSLDIQPKLWGTTGAAWGCTHSGGFHVLPVLCLQNFCQKNCPPPALLSPVKQGSSLVRLCREGLLPVTSQMAVASSNSTPLPAVKMYSLKQGNGIWQPQKLAGGLEQAFIWKSYQLSFIDLFL